MITNMLDQDGVVHARAYFRAPYPTCFSDRDRVLGVKTYKNTQRRTITCLKCITRYL